MPLGKEVDLGPGHIVLDGDSAPHSSPSPLLAHAYCGQTVAFLSNCWALVLFVYEISPELLNGFAPNSHGRRLVPRSDEFEGHQDKKTAFFGPSRPVWFMFGITSLASSFLWIFVSLHALWFIGNTWHYTDVFWLTERLSWLPITDVWKPQNFIHKQYASTDVSSMSTTTPQKNVGQCSISTMHP